MHPRIHASTRHKLTTVREAAFHHHTTLICVHAMQLFISNLYGSAHHEEAVVKQPELASLATPQFQLR
jgi:hypothetical protein